ncbi:hypothetical protein EYF80_054196 [Liparis tanakae]|uniref:Uncharacterized protein n=1 Tax=Liparis tanakae TaxID=230148 RepID=A0A4Z2F3K8_9TELE|nr:hypothetical protein EYF80_054196 [Liparis tanakae]
MCSSTRHAEVGKERNALGSLPELIPRLQTPVNNTSVTMWKPQAGGHSCFRPKRPPPVDGAERRREFPNVFLTPVTSTLQRIGLQTTTGADRSGLDGL